MAEVRTRFAPSPTGYLHVGGIRTALFSWLLAKQHSGQFILRLEDTDKAREVEGSDEHIYRSLKALGLNYDEGPDIGGNLGPYKQSERLDIYKDWAKKLIDKGRAYVDPYTEEEVNEFRLEAKLRKIPFLFRDFRPSKEISWDGSKPLRFKSDPKDYAWDDEVMGKLNASKEAVDDFIIMKSDGYPTYNFAHIIDDELMKISHIIRGQEFLPSIPKYLNLYEALEISHPTFVTTPPVLGPDGKKKLSKRDGAKDILEYIDEGYLVEGLLNFIASLGWNDGSEQEIFSVQELISKFSLNGIQTAGSNFDNKRLIWMNGVHIRELNIEELFSRAKNYWPKSSNNSSEDYLKSVLGLIQERLKYLSEIPELTNFFFEDLPVNLDLINSNPKLRTIDRQHLKDWLNLAKQQLEQSNFEVDDLSSKLNTLLEKTGQKPVILFSLIRIATTQSPSSPGLFETLNVLGKETCLRRIDQQLTEL